MGEVHPRAGSEIGMIFEPDLLVPLCGIVLIIVGAWT